MQLINVISATYTAVDGWLDLSIEADLGNGPETLPFTYAPGDANGLGPQVAAWLAANPGLEPAPHMPSLVSADAVKFEAARRIAETGIGWMVEREVSGGAPIPQAIKDACALIRERSNDIETLDPIPRDFTDDKYWR
jgi:hypothetical protein